MSNNEYLDSPFYPESLRACPWKDTDHLGERRDNYCTWCEGYVAGAEAQKPESVLIEELNRNAVTIPVLQSLVRYMDERIKRGGPTNYAALLPESLVDAHRRAMGVS